jgi:hypothetical protein
MSKVKINSDSQLNPELRDEVQTLRGMINTGEETSRFKKEYAKDKPQVVITDTMTGKQTSVSLYAASNVMDALA